MSARKNKVKKPTIRCAIYTRKSSEEGLDQEFNSLDAQREAAEAYFTPGNTRRSSSRTCSTRYSSNSNPMGERVARRCATSTAHCCEACSAASAVARLKAMAIATLMMAPLPAAEPEGYFTPEHTSTDGTVEAPA